MVFCNLLYMKIFSLQFYFIRTELDLKRKRVQALPSTATDTCAANIHIGRTESDLQR